MLLTSRPASGSAELINIAELLTKMIMLRQVAALMFLAAVVTPVTAQEQPRVLSGPDIGTLIAGNTVVGNMAAGGPYEEFYLPDGTLRGSNYDGSWSVVGDTLCFVYDETSPAQCWGASLTTAGEVLWLKNGVIDGSGVVRSGNPLQF